MSPNQKFILIIACVLPPVLVAAVFLLGRFAGASDDGLRCSRTPAPALCTVRRTAFLGLFGNRTFTVPEASIRAASSDCATNHVGGRGSASCQVYLRLDAGPEPGVLVLSFTVAGQAAAAAQRLNEYLADHSAPAVEIDEDLGTPLLLFAFAPLLLGALVAALRWWTFRPGHAVQ